MMENKVESISKAEAADMLRLMYETGHLRSRRKKAT